MIVVNSDFYLVLIIIGVFVYDLSCSYGRKMRRQDAATFFFVCLFFPFYLFFFYDFFYDVVFAPTGLI